MTQTAKKSKSSSTGKAKKQKELNLIFDLLAPLCKAKEKGAASTTFTKKGAEVVKTAVQDGLIEEKTVKNKTKLYITEKGEMYFLKNIPLDMKMEEITKRKQEIEKTLKTLKAEGQEIFSFYDFGNLPSELKESIGSLHKTCEESTKGIQNILNKFQGASEVITLAERYIKEICETQTLFTEKLENAKAEREERLKEIMSKMGTLESRVSTIAQISAEPPVKTPEITHEATIDDKALVSAMERAYREIVSGKSSRIVDLPELYNRLKKEFPTLAIDHYKKVLNKLCNEAIIDLHPVSDRGELKSPEFGIPTTLGALYYVSWR